MLTVFDSTVVGAIVAVAMALLGWAGWWRTRGMDKEAKKRSTDTESADKRREVIENLDIIIENLQGDNKALRDELGRLYQRIERLEGRIAEIENGRNELDQA